MAAVLVFGAIAVLKDSGRQSSSASPAPKAANGWARRTIKEVSVEAPFDFGAGPDVTGQIPPAAKAVIESMDTYQGSTRNQQFNVLVSRFSFKSGVPLNLDGAIKGAMTKGALAMGDSNPQFTTANTNLSGMEGRRASYHKMISGESVHMEGVVAGAGQRFWQVQVIYVGETRAADAARVLDSIVITPP